MLLMTRDLRLQRPQLLLLLLADVVVLARLFAFGEGVAGGVLVLLGLFVGVGGREWGEGWDGETMMRGRRGGVDWGGASIPLSSTARSHGSGVAFAHLEG